MAVHLAGSPLPFLAVPINAIHMLGSKSQGIFSATIMPHYQLYMAPLSHLHFVFWTFLGASLQLCSPFLSQNCLWPSRSWAGGEVPSSGEGFPDYCRVPKFYHCAHAHPQKTLGSLGTPPATNLCPVTNCEGLGDFFCPWWVSPCLLRHIEYIPYNDIKIFFSNVCLWKVSTFFWIGDYIFKSRMLFSAPFCTTVHMVHAVILQPSVFKHIDYTIFGKPQFPVPSLFLPCKDDHTKLDESP